MDEVTDKNEKSRDEIIKILQSKPVEDFLYPVGKVFSEDLPIFQTTLWKSVLGSFKLIKELLESPLYEIERFIITVADKLNFDREDTAVAHKIASEARYLFVSEGMTVEDLGEELQKSRNRFSYFAGIISELEGYEPKPGVVTLSTYHKAKGLEWDIVFLTGLTYEDFPVNLTDKFKGEQWYLKPEFRNPMAVIKSEMKLVNGSKKLVDSVLMAKLENISERARLLYVGITRAKRYLFLSGHHSNPNRKNEVLPSRYLMELKNYIDIYRQKLSNN
jgi:DNA helicase-2/ATP-dependent DNA helicase PcrA